MEGRVCIDTVMSVWLILEVDIVGATTHRVQGVVDVVGVDTVVGMVQVVERRSWMCSSLCSRR